MPVRAGSRRLKNKNIAPFGGTNLLLYKIAQLQRVKAIDRIVVSSDSDAMLEMAANAGAATHRRALEYCDEKTRSFGEVVRHIAESVEGEHVLWATCTSPLVFPTAYARAFSAYEQALAEGYDSLMSVYTFRRYLWNAEGPLNYELGLKHVPSQQLPPLQFVTDGILIAPRQRMIEWSYFHGPNPHRFEVTKREAVDIDDTHDLLEARALLDTDPSVMERDPYFT
ncbi:acylneuraminate cytidylyltransferase family protein [Phycisphaera mikurensis]|uniref:acylneuraminate cytidylyltransferase family protein n=1 Tax=Phycisphaera mikurensis TaxID=547188 RepID=UPI0021BBB899|nr:NTP transferase domain-containing protein [Phycisphaera mikurensis]